MSTGLKGLYQFGGAAFVVSGLLFLSRAILDLIAGAPPSSGVEILAWIASNSLIQDFQSEILFFAAGFLAPAVVALYLSLAMKSGAYGKPVVYLGFATAVVDIIGSYPYAIGSVLTLVSQVFFAAWFIAVGTQLYNMRGNPAAAQHAPEADGARRVVESRL